MPAASIRSEKGVEGFLHQGAVGSQVRQQSTELNVNKLELSS